MKVNPFSASLIPLLAAGTLCLSGLDAKLLGNTDQPDPRAMLIEPGELQKK